MVSSEHETLQTRLREILLAVRKGDMSIELADREFQQMLVKYRADPANAVLVAMILATQAKSCVPGNSTIFDPEVISFDTLIQAKKQLILALGDVRGMPNPTWATSVITLARVCEALAGRADDMDFPDEWRERHLEKAYTLLGPDHAAFEGTDMLFPAIRKIAEEIRTRIGNDLGIALQPAAAV